MQARDAVQCSVRDVNGHPGAWQQLLGTVRDAAGKYVTVLVKKIYFVYAPALAWVDGKCRVCNSLGLKNVTCNCIERRRPCDTGT